MVVNDVPVRDEVTVGNRQGTDKLYVRIVGVVEQPRSLPPLGLSANMPSMRVTVLKRGPADSALYVSTAVAEKLTLKQFCWNINLDTNTRTPSTIPLPQA